jgi:phosphate transport system protein
MTRSDYTAQLQQIHDDLLMLGSMVEKSLIKAIDALRYRDLEASRSVIEDDDVIDQFQQVLEEKCVDVIALQAPMASDLRRIVTVIQVASELERIGDYAEGIAKISVRMGGEPTIKPLVDIPRMAETVARMLRDGLGALTTLDVQLAEQVADTDDSIDSLYEQVFRELSSFMVENPANIQSATYLIWIAHLLERIGDRSTNIAERAVYLATGKMKHFR